MEDIFKDSKVSFRDGILTDDDVKKPLIIHISILYSIGMALFMFCPPVFRVFFNSSIIKGMAANLARMTGMSRGLTLFYMSGILSEIVLVLLPAVILILLYRYDFRKVLRLNRVRPLNLFIVFWIMVFALPAVGVLNLLNMWLVKLAFGKISPAAIPSAENWIGLLLGILVIGGSAGICEEIMFRGVIQRGFERFGAVKAILITSLLFGLIHRDIQRLFGTAALGAVIGFLVYRSNSIYSGMFAHFSNNSIAVLMGYAYSRINKVVQIKGAGGTGSGDSLDQLVSTYSNLPAVQLMAVIIFWLIILTAFTAALVGLIYAYLHITSDKVVRVKREKPVSGVKGTIWLVPGLLLVGFIYFVQGMTLQGKTIKVLEGMIKALGLG